MTSVLIQLAQGLLTLGAVIKVVDSLCHVGHPSIPLGTEFSRWMASGLFGVGYIRCPSKGIEHE